MTDTRDDGGPAFPVMLPIESPSGRKIDVPFRGMSLRDFFAAQALAGLHALSHDAIVTVIGRDALRLGETQQSETYARLAYEAADAMLKARTVRPVTDEGK